MKSEIKWRPLALGMVLALTAAAARPVMAYQYVLSGPSTYEYEDDPEDSSTSTSIEFASASSSATTDGDCSCTATSHTWATDGDGAVAYSQAYATWQKTWEWDGPPGEAPGGTLSWSHTWGEGYTTAFGGIDRGTNGGGMSVANADSDTSGSGSGTGCYGTSNAFGYTDDRTYAYGSASATGQPQDGWYDTGDLGSGNFQDSYSHFIIWDQNADGDDSIASGTTYVYFGGGALCENWSGAGAGPLGSEAEADARSAATASVSLSASFSSN